MLRQYRLDVDVERVVRHWGLLSSRGETAAAGIRGRGGSLTQMLCLDGAQLADQARRGAKGGDIPG